MRAKQDKTALTAIPILSVLNEEELMRFESVCKYETMPKYAFVFEGGQKADFVYLLAKGHVKVSSFSNDGKEIIKYVVHPGEMIGELSLVGNDTYINDAQALKEEIGFYKIGVEPLQQLMCDIPALNLKIMGRLGKRLQQTEKRLEAIIFRDARSRIVDFLVQSAKERGKKVGFEVLLPRFLTHKEIANLTATSRQTVTMVFNELRRLNLIYIYNRRSILIRDMDKLAVQ